MRHELITCDVCGKENIPEPDYLGKNFTNIEHLDKTLSVNISVDWPAERPGPVGELDTCTVCFWAIVQKAMLKT